MMNGTVYTDRWGKAHKPRPDSRYKDRDGVFGVFQKDGFILLTWPGCAPDVAELPGGGIDVGEGYEAALYREAYEETGELFSNLAIEKEYEQDSFFYAENSNEYWNYRQKYVVFDLSRVDIDFSKRLDPDDAQRAEWFPMDELSTLSFHAVHKDMMVNMKCWPVCTSKISS